MDFTPTSPIRPRALHLPFHDLAWERFEGFCLDLISRLPNFVPGSVHRFGRQGNKQDGIDIMADHLDGNHWAFSNKRYATYHVSHAKAHIADTTYAADEFRILLSTVASTEVRKEVRQHARWDVWDADDLSQRVRELASAKLDDARRLVDDHFGPHWRREFLGLPAIATFRTPLDHFRPWKQPGRLFHHCHPLVGRAEWLQSLHAFVNSPQHRVAILSGSGGIGKTRLLCGFADEFECEYADKALIRFLAEEFPISQEGLDELPARPCVVVADDAHRYPDLGLLLQWVQQHDQSKVLLATRPHGRDMLLSMLNRTGFDVRQIVDVKPLRPLEPEDQLRLASEALGSPNELLVEQLAQATRDCPLETVIGGLLLRDNALPPELFERNPDFQRVLLDRFQGELLGQVSSKVPADLCLRLLRFYAALAPFPVEDRNFYAALSRRLGIDVAELISVTAELEHCGILLRRGRQLRITPDVLADHILHQACVTKLGVPTGFATEVFAAFLKVCPREVLRNLAELDWRVEVTSGGSLPLLAEVWHYIVTEFFSASHAGRAHWLDLFNGVPFFQPRPIVALVERAMREPAPEIADGAVGGLPGVTHRDVVHRIVNLLGQAAYSPDQTGICLDLLWELGRDDGGADAYGSQAMPTLTQLAGYAPGKSLDISRQAVRAVERWLKAPDAHSQHHSPLNVLAPVLEKSGIDHIPNGGGWKIGAFSVPFELVHDIQNEAIRILAECLASTELPVAVRAVNLLGIAIDDPKPYFNMQFDEAALSQWEPQQQAILRVFSSFFKSASHPLARATVLDYLGSEVRHARLSSVRESAKLIVEEVGDDYEVGITRLLVPRLSTLNPFDEAVREDIQDNLSERRTRGLQRLRSAVQTEFVKRHSTIEEALAELDRRLVELLPCEPEANAAQMIDLFLDARPDQVEKLANRILKFPDSPTNTCFGICLSILERTGRFVVNDWARRGLATGQQTICRITANYCSWRAWDKTEPAADDLDLLNTLLKHPDESVRRGGIGSLRRLLTHHPRVALDAARTVDVGGSNELAADLCGLADEQFGRPDVITADDYRALLTQLQEVETFDHPVIALLQHAADKVPDAVVALLLSRIKRSGAANLERYRPVPRQGLESVFSSLEGHPLHQELLVEVRDALLSAGDDMDSDLSRLYRWLSLDFADTGISVLTEWLGSEDCDRITAIGRLLDEAGPNLVFNRTDFVTHLFERAAQCGTNCLDFITWTLYGATVDGATALPSGDQNAWDGDLEEGAQVVLLTLAPASPARKLYEQIQLAGQRFAGKR